MDSILTSIKKLLGVSEDYTQFDDDIIMHINSVFLNLAQLGVGPKTGFSIRDASDEWTDFVDIESNEQLQAIKTYMYLKVKLLFDPPLSSSVIDSINRTIAELEWRLNAAVD